MTLAQYRHRATSNRAVAENYHLGAVLWLKFPPPHASTRFTTFSPRSAQILYPRLRGEKKGQGRRQVRNWLPHSLRQEVIPRECAEDVSQQFSFSFWKWKSSEAEKAAGRRPQTAGPGVLTTSGRGREARGSWDSGPFPRPPAPEPEHASLPRRASPLIPRPPAPAHNLEGTR